MQTLLEVIGWVGSGLIVFSLMQARVLRFRWMNMIGSLIATVYNAIIEVWPFAAMNAVIAVISAYWLRRLYRESSDPLVYRVVRVEPEDAYLQHVLAVHGEDIRRHAPLFEPRVEEDSRLAFLVVRGDEAVGVVALKPAGQGVATIELDWVKPRFRDFTPGHFVYEESGALPAAGIRQVQLIPHDATDREYLRKAGFRLENERWIRDLEPAA